MVWPATTSAPMSAAGGRGPSSVSTAASSCGARSAWRSAESCKGMRGGAGGGWRGAQGLLPDSHTSRPFSQAPPRVREGQVLSALPPRVSAPEWLGDLFRIGEVLLGSEPGAGKQWWVGADYW